jgi:hypothetical protein
LADSRRKGSGFLKSREIFLRKKPQGNAISSYLSKTRQEYPSCSFTVIPIGWMNFARILPNNWLDETPLPLAVRRLGRQSAERERISEIKGKFF